MISVYTADGTCGGPGHRAHGSRRRARRRQRRGMPPHRGREGDPWEWYPTAVAPLLLLSPPPSPPHTRVPEAGLVMVAAAGSAAAGRDPRACVEGCCTCGRELGASRTASANPARERREEPEEEKGAKPSQ